MSPLRNNDAFGPTADPSAYVPRLALESVLAELVELTGRMPACAVLIGEPGLGKTLLLRVLAERLEGAFESLYVPFPRLDPAEFWAWAAAALGIPRSTDDRSAVLEHARRHADDGHGLVLLVDDAGALPLETRAELMDACRTTGFAVVMAFTSDDRGLLADLPEFVRRIELGPPMTPAETRAYVRARLRRVDPGGVVAERIDSARMAELHEASGGVPARLHALLDAWLRGRPAEPLARGTATATAPAPAEPAATGVGVAREPFFRRRERRRNQLALAIVLVLLLAGYWRFAPSREPSVEAGAVAAEPPRAEAPLPELADSAPDLDPEAAPSPEAELALDPEPEPAVVAAPEPELVPAPEPATDELAVAPELAEDAAPDVPAPPVAEALQPLEETAPAEQPAAAPEPVAAVAAAPPAEEPAPFPALPPVSLAPPPAGPRLSVDAEPWAEIQVDGRPVGETPLGDLPLPPGSHRVSAKLPDGRVLERRVEMRGGDVYLVFP